MHSGRYSHVPWRQHRPDRPFAYISGRRFIGFTPTLLTPEATPTNGHAPYFLQRSKEHAVFTQALLPDWLPLSTHSIVIGRVLPPAGACCEFCFSFFFSTFFPVFYTHSWEKRQPVRQKNHLYPCLCRLFVLHWLQQQKSDIYSSFSSMPARKYTEMDSNGVRQINFSLKNCYFICILLHLFTAGTGFDHLKAQSSA